MSYLGSIPTRALIHTKFKRFVAADGTVTPIPPNPTFHVYEPPTVLDDPVSEPHSTPSSNLDTVVKAAPTPASSASEDAASSSVEPSGSVRGAAACGVDMTRTMVRIDEAAAAAVAAEEEQEKGFRFGWRRVRFDVVGALRKAGRNIRHKTGCFRT